MNFGDIFNTYPWLLPVGIAIIVLIAILLVMGIIGLILFFVFIILPIIIIVSVVRKATRKVNDTIRRVSPLPVPTIPIL